MAETRPRTTAISFTEEAYRSVVSPINIHHLGIACFLLLNIR